MSKTITKHIGEGFASGELHSALAYDSSDKFGGYEIKSILLNWASYEDGDGRVCFYDENMYIAPYTKTELDIVAPDAIWLMSSNIYFYGTVHWAGGSHEVTNTEFDVLLTNPTSGANALHGEIDAGSGWTSTDNLVGVRGKVDISTTAGAGDATGVWAGLDITGNFTRNGLVCGLNVEVQSTKTASPNAIVYIQSLPKSGSNFNAVPYIAFTENEGGTNNGSNLLFSLGHQPAGSARNVTSGISGDLLYNDTIRIEANGNIRYIPLSTNEGTFTTTRAIITTFATTAIDIGACATGILVTDANFALDIVTDGKIRMGTMDVGIPVETDYPYALEVHTEPLTTLTAGETGLSCGIRSRYHIGVAQANQISITAIEGRLRVKAALADGVHSAISGTIEAGKDSETIAFTGTATTQRSAGNFCVELSAQSTLANDGWLTGVTIDSSVHGSVDVSTHCTFAGLRIKTSSEKEPWTYGIYMGDDDAVTGIYIGTCTTGINVEGTVTLALGIGATTPLTTETSTRRAVYVRSNYAKTDGYHFGAQFLSQYTVDGTGSLRALVGQVDYSGTQTIQNTAQQLVGVHGRAQVSGTVYNTQLQICGVMAQILNGGTWTEVGKLYGLWVDNQLQTNPSTGTVAMIGIRQNNGVSTLVVDHVFDIYGAVITNLFNFDSCEGNNAFIEEGLGAVADGTIKRIRCLIDGTPYYIIASTAPTNES